MIQVNCRNIQVPSETGFTPTAETNFLRTEIVPHLNADTVCVRPSSIDIRVDTITVVKSITWIESSDYIEHKKALALFQA